MTRREEILLVALADGTLSGRRLAEAEALADSLPDGGRLIARQRRVGRALGATPAAVPARRRWSLRMAPVVAVGAALAVCLAILPGGDSLTTDAAALSTAPATAPPPATDGTRLRASVDGVAFPDWGERFGWHRTGARRDTIDGRFTRTVFYEHMGHRIAYTIVAGPPASVPGGARVAVRNGMRVALRRDGDRTIATFERDGHTCVLAGHVLHESTLVELATWRA
jgi:hypothetical protein